MDDDTVSMVTQIIAAALELPVGRVKEEDSVETIKEWDSLGHLNILIALDKRFSGRVAKIPELGKATSIRSIVEALEAHHVI